MACANINDAYDTDSTDLETYIDNVYNTEIANNQNYGTKFSIKDFGHIRFAENDRRSKYVRIPFKPVVDNGEPSVVLPLPRRDSSECLDDMDLDNRLTSADLRKHKSKSMVECIVDLMRDGWKLPPPHSIISVTGGAHLFKLATPRARYAFQRGLIAAAVTTDAWIITGGTHAGVMKEVGDAVDKRRYKNTRTPSKVQCIGIGSWHYTTDHEHLLQQRPSPPPLLSSRTYSTLSVPSLTSTSSIISRNDDHSIVAIDSVLPQIPGAAGKHTNPYMERTRIYRNRAVMANENSCPLDPNHTHFILLDDMLDENSATTYNEFIQRVNCRADLTIKVRAEIERQASSNYSIPIVQILANGGASSILTVCKALEQQTPVIVIEGTGRAADEIAREYRYLYGNQSTKDDEQRSIEFYNKASSKFHDFATRIRSTPGPKTSLNHTNREQFIEQLTSRHGYFLISTFQFQNDQGEQKLDDAILHSLFNVARIMPNGKDQRITELKLAMAWNKFDRIRRTILTDKTILKWTDLELDRALSDSLRMNKVRFVDLLIEYGASFDRLQRFNLVERLYREIETRVLPYSKLMMEKIYRDEQQLNWTKKTKKYFYEDYLNIDRKDEQVLLNESITNYGILEDENMPTNSASSFHHSVCVFNALDMIQVNGFLNTISIRFDSTKAFSANRSIYCYLISPTNDPNSFLIAYKCLLRSISKNSSNLCHYENANKQNPLFVTNGQYIAIGFTHRTGFPCNLSQRNQHSLRLNQVEKLCPLPAKKSVQFTVDSSQGVAIAFNIIPSPELFRDLFFWSLFYNRYTMATYLCSKSSNTVLAALFASKIYHQAVSYTNETEKRLDSIKKEKEFDKHASIIMDMCFDENDQFALDILTKRSPLFFNKNPLQIAKENNSRAFLATKTVQRYLDQQWYGHLDEYGHDSFWISSLIFIMCLIPFLIPIQALSRLIISDKRQLKAWEKKPHIIGWSARIFYRFKEFYRGRAMVRFYYNIVFYILFLTLFSFVLLVDYFPLNINGGQRNGYEYILIPVSEIFVHILMWSLIVEEGKEFIQHWDEEKKNQSRHIIWNYYMQDKWNILDMIAIVIYLLGFITRFIVIEEAFIASKILMCIDLFLWYIRILHIFAAYERLGPKLLMIFNTMKDLVFFIYFILIFLAGYSVTSYALIITNHQVFWEDIENKSSSSRQFQVFHNGTGLWSWQILRDVIDWGMWKVYGQVDLDTNHHFGTKSDIEIGNDAYGITAYVFTIFFVCIANILLLNVLVALFNVTIQKVDDSAHESWAYHRFLLVTEYNSKTFLPPPLNILVYIFHHIYQFFKKCRPRKTNDKYGIHDDDKITEIDSNLFDMVVFNAVDRIRHSTGFINAVTINFKSPPLIHNPSITLYLLSSEGNNSNTFHVNVEQSLSTNNIQQGQKGVQTIALDSSVPCCQGQFVALAFGEHSGSPTSVKDRNEHPINLAHFCRIKNQDKLIVFANYPNKGAAFSFVIEQTIKGQSNQVALVPTRRNQLDNQSMIQMTEPRKSLSHSQKISNTSVGIPSSIVTAQNKFKERDNMLRESSIAEDYWKRVIDTIKQQETRIAEEQNDNIDSPIDDSVNENFEGNNTTMQQTDDAN